MEFELKPNENNYKNFFYNYALYLSQCKKISKKHLLFIEGDKVLRKRCGLSEETLNKLEENYEKAGNVGKDGKHRVYYAINKLESILIINGCLDSASDIGKNKIENENQNYYNYNDFFIDDKPETDFNDEIIDKNLINSFNEGIYTEDEFIKKCSLLKKNDLSQTNKNCEIKKNDSQIKEKEEKLKIIEDDETTNYKEETGKDFENAIVIESDEEVIVIELNKQKEKKEDLKKKKEEHPTLKNISLNNRYFLRDKINSSTELPIIQHESIRFLGQKRNPSKDHQTNNEKLKKIKMCFEKIDYEIYGNSEKKYK